MPKQVKFTLKNQTAPEDLAAGVAVRSQKNRNKKCNSFEPFCVQHTSCSLRCKSAAVSRDVLVRLNSEYL